MKQEDVKIGETYLVKVAGDLLTVQIISEHPTAKAWNGRLVSTGRTSDLHI
jgi:hypothetical protein